LQARYLRIIMHFQPIYEFGFHRVDIQTQHACFEAQPIRCLHCMFNLYYFCDALREAIEACQQTLDVKTFAEFSGFRVGQWSDGVDEFYKNFRNKSLDIELAMRYVGQQLHGKPAKELEDEVTGWRRSAAK
jgi:hypothetical protein